VFINVKLAIQIRTMLDPYRYMIS